MRSLILSMYVCLMIHGCAGSKPEQTTTPNSGTTAANSETPPVVDAAPPPPDPSVISLHCRGTACFIVVEGRERVVDRAAARTGYTEVDFSDGWTPRIFQPQNGPDGQPMANRYRRIFIGLSNDETDGDGRPLPKDEKNYLEVFGIPPSMGVIRDRFVGDAASQCLAGIDFKLIGSLEKLTYRNRAKERRHKATMRRYRRTLKKALKKAATDDLEQLKLKRPDLAKQIAYVMTADHEARVLAEIEKRLECDQHNHKRYRHKKGVLDTGLRHAVRRFQRKHKIYEHTNLRKTTMVRMAQRPEMTNFLSFQRTVEERIFAATGILEDGSVEDRRGKPFTYKDTAGSERVVRNLREEYRKALEEQLNLNEPSKVLAFFKRWKRSEFSWLRVGVKFPEVPPYYSDTMDLKLVIDRGSVWYDFPMLIPKKASAERKCRRPLCRYRAGYSIGQMATTGGWRTDQAPNGYVYLKIKGLTSVTGHEEDHLWAYLDSA